MSNCDIEWFESQVKDEAVATLLVSERKTEVALTAADLSVIRQEKDGICVATDT